MCLRWVWDAWLVASKKQLDPWEKLCSSEERSGERLIATEMVIEAVHLDGTAWRQSWREWERAPGVFLNFLRQVFIGSVMSEKSWAGQPCDNWLSNHRFLGSANALVESITLVRLTQHRSHQICSSSGSAVMRHIEQQDQKPLTPAKTVGRECLALQAGGGSYRVHPGAPELGGWAASPQPVLLVPLLQVLLQMLCESSGNLPSALAGGSPASRRSEELSFSHHVLSRSTKL